MNNNQQDIRWANLLLGFSDLTIRLYGCVISVIGNALGVTPDVVNTLLKNVDGFARNGSTNPDGTDQKILVDWNKLSQAFPGITATIHNTYDNATVLLELAKGNRVLVFVSATPIGGTGMHCIEYIGNGRCKDPWTGTIRPTSDFPDVLGEWVSISGTWQQTTPLLTPAPTSAVNVEGLNTYGLDPTNEASNQIVFKTWHDVSQGLYIPVAQYKALELSNETLRENFDKLTEKQNETFKELTETNGTLQGLKKSDFDYGQEAVDATKLTKTYVSYMDDFAAQLDLPQNNQTDAQLHEEIIKEIVTLRQNQKTTESEAAPDKALTTWESGFKSIVDWIIQHGLNDYLKENNLQVVDLEGNPQDDGIGDRVITYLDNRFHQIDVLESAVTNVKTQVIKGKNLLEHFFGLFYKST